MQDLIRKFMKKEEEESIKVLIFQCVGTIIGAAIMACGVSFFLLPNQLSSGGFSGIATILYYLLKFPMGTVILCLNVPLFLFSIFVLGKKFFLKSIIGTISLSGFIDLFDQFTPLTDDRFLACIYGGIITGVGTAIILKSHSSTGGSELISNIAKGFNHNLRMSTVIMVFDIIVVSLNVFFFRKVEIGLYSAIAIYLMGKMVDIVFEGVYFTKLVIIISDKTEEIAKLIGDNIKRGTTGLYRKRYAYSKGKTYTYMCSRKRRCWKSKNNSKKN